MTTVFCRNNSIRKKRSDSNAQNFFIEYLIVIDDTVYNQFVSLFGNLNDSLLMDYINIFFCQIINGVNFICYLLEINLFIFNSFLQINQRYINSFGNDPDLSLMVSLKNVLYLVSYFNKK